MNAILEIAAISVCGWLELYFAGNGDQALATVSAVVQFSRRSSWPT